MISPHNKNTLNYSVCLYQQVDSSSSSSSFSSSSSSLCAFALVSFRFVWFVCFVILFRFFSSGLVFFCRFPLLSNSLRAVRWLLWLVCCVVCVVVALVVVFPFLFRYFLSLFLSSLIVVVLSTVDGHCRSYSSSFLMIIWYDTKQDVSISTSLL